MPNSAIRYPSPTGDAPSFPAHAPAVSLHVPQMVETATSRQERGHPHHRVVGGPNGSTPPASAPVDRQRLLERASEIEQLAREAAERGELATAARKILESLDCERRAGGLGPQVLQLIKPRN